jgi:hypothetical protein
MPVFCIIRIDAASSALATPTIVSSTASARHQAKIADRTRGPIPWPRAAGAIATVRSATLLRTTSTTTIGEIPRRLCDEIEIVFGHSLRLHELCARDHLSVANGPSSLAD